MEEISVPGGRWDRRVIQACAAAGYRRVYVSDPWVEAEMSGFEVIGRFMVRRTTTIAELTELCPEIEMRCGNCAYAHSSEQGLVGVLGDSLYHRLWCRLDRIQRF